RGWPTKAKHAVPATGLYRLAIGCGEHRAYIQGGSGRWLITCNHPCSDRIWRRVPTRRLRQLSSRLRSCWAGRQRGTRRAPPVGTDPAEYSTPPQEVAAGPQDREDSQGIVLNASRHHRKLHGQGQQVPDEGWFVLNASRHHRKLHWQYPREHWTL